jgi:hypothetical protein
LKNNRIKAYSTPVIPAVAKRRAGTATGPGATARVGLTVPEKRYAFSGMTLLLLELLDFNAP